MLRAALLGLGTTALAIAFATLLIWGPGVLPWSFTVLFVVPAGAMVGGAMCASGLAFGLRDAFVPPSWRTRLAAVAFAMLGCIGTLAAMHRVSGAAAQGEPFAAFAADAIDRSFQSVWIAVGRIPRVRHLEIPDGPDLEPPPAARVLGRVSFALEVVGFVLGALLVSSMIWGHRRVCPGCGAGFRERALLCYGPWPLDLAAIPRDPHGLAAWIATQRAAMRLPRGAHVRVEADLCSRPACKHGNLVVTPGGGGPAVSLALDDTAAWSLKLRRAAIPLPSRPPIDGVSSPRE